METQATVAGRFRIEQQLGEGATADVFAARDLVLDREVALKIPRGGAGFDADTAAGIAREARAAGRLHDPHIVTVFDVTEDGGRPVIVMELIRGPSLAQRLQESGRLPAPEALRIAAAIAAALAYAHQAGIVHGDVKPSNVLLGDDGAVKLTDFGIAHAAASHEPSLRTDGAVLGSLHYLAPELATGGDPTPASDLYALGVMLQQLLDGIPPLPAARVPDGLTQLGERLRAPLPADRPSDAGAVAAELAAWSAALADPLSAPTVRFAATRPARRPRADLRPALGALVLSTAAIVLLVLFTHRPHDVVVPDLRVDSAAAATLDHLGLHLRRLSEPNRTVANGALIRQEPQAGTHVTPGSEVRLVFSSGRPFVAVPNVVGSSLAAAWQTLTGRRLRLAVFARPSTAPMQTILEQSPRTGTRVHEDDVVEAMISSGPPLDEAAFQPRPNGHARGHRHGHKHGD